MHCFLVGLLLRYGDLLLLIGGTFYAVRLCVVAAGDILLLKDSGGDCCCCKKCFKIGHDWLEQCKNWACLSACELQVLCTVSRNQWQAEIHSGCLHN